MGRVLTTTFFSVYGCLRSLPLLAEDAGPSSPTPSSSLSCSRSFTLYILGHSLPAMWRAKRRPRRRYKGPPRLCREATVGWIVDASYMVATSEQGRSKTARAPVSNKVDIRTQTHAHIQPKPQNKKNHKLVLLPPVVLEPNGKLPFPVVLEPNGKLPFLVALEPNGKLPFPVVLEPRGKLAFRS